MKMSFINTLMGNLAAAVDAIGTAAQNIVEKKRTDVKLDRIREFMKSESELMNRAYIALGKGYYEQIKKGAKPNTEREEKLVKLIDNCKARIAKARDCYRKILESRAEALFVSDTDKQEEHFEKKDVVDITVACSNENEYDSSPFEKNEEKKDLVEEIADEIIDDESPIDELF